MIRVARTDREFAPGLESYVERTLHGAKRLHTHWINRSDAIVLLQVGGT